MPPYVHLGAMGLPRASRRRRRGCAGFFLTVRRPVFDNFCHEVNGKYTVKAVLAHQGSSPSDGTYYVAERLDGDCRWRKSCGTEITVEDTDEFEKQLETDSYMVLFELSLVTNI